MTRLRASWRFFVIVLVLLMFSWAKQPALELSFDALARVSSTTHFRVPPGTAVPADALDYTDSWRGQPLADVRCPAVPPVASRERRIAFGDGHYRCESRYRLTARSTPA